MAKATAAGVTLELAASEARALHALVGGTCQGCFSDEVNSVFEALESAGVSSDDFELAWSPEHDGVFIKRDE